MSPHGCYNNCLDETLDHRQDDDDVHAYMLWGMCVHYVLDDDDRQSANTLGHDGKSTDTLCHSCFPRRAAEIPSVSQGNGVLPKKEKDHSKVEFGFENAHLTKTILP